MHILSFLSGRGSLGRWGPNHAADPIVTRWSKTGNEIEIDSATGKPKLLFLAIQRRVGKMWAFPGGTYMRRNRSGNHVPLVN